MNVVRPTRATVDTSTGQPSSRVPSSSDSAWTSCREIVAVPNRAPRRTACASRVDDGRALDADGVDAAAAGAAVCGELPMLRIQTCAPVVSSRAKTSFPVVTAMKTPLPPGPFSK
jgi:hypothetical protein